MLRLRTLTKYVFILFILLFIGIGVVQTRTFVHVVLKGSYEVTDGNYEPNAPAFKNSGYALITNLGSNSDGGGREDPWTEVVGEDRKTIEEYEEGAYHILENEWKKFVWENDEWDGHYNYSGPGMSTCLKQNTTDGSCQSAATKDGNWRGVVQQLEDHGWAIIPFSPTYSQRTGQNYQVGFVGNPEVTDRHGNARYKKHLARNYRNGIGAFVVAIPARGHYIKSVNIRDRNASTNDTSGSFITFQSPVKDPNCNDSKCFLDYDNDFTYCNNCWFGGDSRAFNAAPSRKQIENNITNLSINTIPKNAQIGVGNDQVVGADNQFMFKAYSLSPRSNFKSRECIGCLHDAGEKTYYTNIWNRVFEYLGNNEGLNTMLTGLNGTNSGPLAAINPCYGYNLIGKQGCESTEQKLMGSNYSLNLLKERREQPVVIGIIWAFEGGDLWQAAEPIKGHEGTYLDVYNYIDSDFQIFIEFAEKGYNLDVKIVKPDGSIDYNESNIKAIASWDKSPKDFYDSGENLADMSDVTMTFGGSTDTCIPTINVVTKNSIVNDSGEKLVEQVSTINNGLLYPLSLRESIVFGKDNNEFSKGGNERFKTLHQNFGNSASSEYPDFLGINNIQNYYTFFVHTFEPKFFVSSADENRKGEYWVDRYMRPSDWEAFVQANGNNDTAKFDIAFTNKLRSQGYLGSGFQKRWCGFLNSIQEVVVKPKFENKYYFYSLTTANAQVYTYNHFDDPENDDILVKYDDISSSNVQFSVEQFKIYAKSLSTGPAFVDFVFKPFPKITVSKMRAKTKQVRDDDGSTFATPNRLIVSSPAEINNSNKFKDLMFFKDSSVEFYIQPNTSQMDSNTANDKTSITFDIDKKLERIYLEYDNTPISFFTDLNPVTMGSTRNITGYYRTISMKDNISTTVDIGTNLLPATVSGSSTTFYRLELPVINENLTVFLDFVPYLLHFRTVTHNFNEIKAIAESTIGNTKSLIDVAIPSRSYGVSVMETSDVTSTELMGGTLKATYNDSKQLDVKVVGKESRTNYYIDDIIELKVEDSGSIIVDDTNPKSKLNDLYNNLKSNNSLFHALIDSNAYQTSNTVRDTNIYLSVSKYSSVFYRLRDYEDSTNTNLGSNTLFLDYSGIVNPGPGELETELSQNTAWTQVKPNRIATSFSETEEVGFRKWDNAKFQILPDPGWAIQEIWVATKNIDDLSINNDDLTLYDAAPLTKLLDIDPPPRLEMTFNEVSVNMYIEIRFRKIPTQQSLYSNPLL
ncbi:MAG: hypothetical protein VW397_01010 [Candidatus Margulisiibacteriota bacterium]